MDDHTDLVRDMRRLAGLSIEDRHEEELVAVPQRTPEFALKEVQDLAGMNDFQPDPPKT